MGFLDGVKRVEDGGDHFIVHHESKPAPFPVPKHLLSSDSRMKAQAMCNGGAVKKAADGDAGKDTNTKFEKFANRMNGDSKLETLLSPGPDPTAPDPALDLTHGQFGSRQVANMLGGGIVTPVVQPPVTDGSLTNALGFPNVAGLVGPATAATPAAAPASTPTPAPQAQPTTAPTAPAQAPQGPPSRSQVLQSLGMNHDTMMAGHRARMQWVQKHLTPEQIKQLGYADGGTVGVKYAADGDAGDDTAAATPAVTQPPVATPLPNGSVALTVPDGGSTILTPAQAASYAKDNGINYPQGGFTAPPTKYMDDNRVLDANDARLQPQGGAQINPQKLAQTFGQQSSPLVTVPASAPGPSINYDPSLTPEQNRANIGAQLGANKLGLPTQSTTQETPAKGYTFNYDPSKSIEENAQLAQAARLSSKYGVTATVPAGKATAAPGFNASADMSDWQRGVDQQARGINAEAAANAEHFKNSANAHQALFDTLTGIRGEANDMIKASDTEFQTLKAAVAKGELDPNDYWDKSPTWHGPGHSRIMAGVAMALGSFGSSINGGPNYAAQYLEKEIDRNMEAQKVKLQRNKDLLNLNQAEYTRKMNELDWRATKEKDLLGLQLQKEGDLWGSATAKARADQAAGQLFSSSAAQKRQIIGQDLANKAFGPLTKLKMQTEQADIDLKRSQLIGSQLGQVQTVQDMDLMNKIQNGQAGKPGSATPGVARGLGGGGLDPKILTSPAFLRNPMFKELGSRVVHMDDGSVRFADSEKDAQEIKGAQDDLSPLQMKLDKYEKLRAAHPSGIWDTSLGGDPGDYSEAKRLYDGIRSDLGRLNDNKRLSDVDLHTYTGELPDITSWSPINPETKTRPIRSISDEIGDKILGVYKHRLSGR